MKPDLATAVGPVFARGLELYGQPNDGAARLTDARPWLVNHLAALRQRERDPWPITYALAAWLDELLIRKAPAGQSTNWEADTLEWEFFESRGRATTFWENADHALTAAMSQQPGALDVLEVYALCVRFGFLGDREKLTERDSWLQQAAPLLAGPTAAPAPPLPRGGAAQPGLYGLRKLRRARQLVWFPVLAAAVLVAAVVVTELVI